MTTTTISIVMGIVILVLGLLVFYRMRQNNSGNQDQIQMNAVPNPEQIADGKRELEQIIKNFPRVKELVQEAKQTGATHFGGAGPAIAFYRIHDGKVEECFAEFTPGKGYHEWVWPPSEWHAGEKRLPKNAKPIPEDI
jgi:hypothetical protein